MTQESVNPSEAKTPGSSIEYSRFLDCVHCGLCTSACPTYVETGDENDSPRGRIYLMRAVVDGRLALTDRIQNHLDLCLDCRSCETACPSGVQYGRLIEPFRAEQHATPTHGSDAKPDWFHRWIIFGLFPFRVRMKWALLPVRVLQAFRVDRLMQRVGLLRLLPARLRRMHEQLPQLRRSTPELPEFSPAIGPRRAKVALFTGCVADAMFRHIHWATIRVLQQNGCDVVVPQNQACCGAIHYHGGAPHPAQHLMTANIDAFSDSSLDAVIVNVAGCGSMLKDYGEISHELSGQPASGAQDFIHRVCDVSEFLHKLGLVAPTGALTVKAVMQDACHLQHAQRVRQQPRNLLNQIPGLSLVEIRESELCCGAAGSYNLTQPEMADRLGERKILAILAADPQLIITGNAGCSLQLQAQLRKHNRQLKVVHPMELLDLSYRGLPLGALV